MSTPAADVVMRHIDQLCNPPAEYFTMAQRDPTANLAFQEASLVSANA